MKHNGQMENPLRDLISDGVYLCLIEHGLLDQVAVRNYRIRKTFKELRRQMKVADAIDFLHQEYPYISYETLRKIAYDVQ
jgi:hypothetical protein